MRAYRPVTLGAAAITAAWLVVAAPASADQLPLEPTGKEFGQSVWPVYEGWYDNPDGSFTLLIGYFNPNSKQTFDIPIGGDNHFSPGVPDRGQPTHFATGRGWGVFTVRVPKDFGDTQLTWTITTNNRTQAVPMHLDPQWYIEPFLDAANKNRPPAVRFEPDGRPFEGPPTEIATTLTARVGAPLTVNLWTSDVKGIDLRTAASRQTATNARPERVRRPVLVLRWSKLRGAGEVTFGELRQEFDTSDQNPTNTVTFSQPGEYILRVEALDETGVGGGGSQCCWTSAHLKIVVNAEHTGNQ